MECSSCKSTNEPDATFCQECGTSLGDSLAASKKTQRSYRYMFVLVPVLAIVLSIGYYKFFLPDGIAAVVNGEEIRLSEVDAVVTRTQGQGNGNAPAGMLRRQVLQQVILERIVLQEAQKAQTVVSQEEVTSATAELAKASGSDVETFKKEIKTQYGSLRAFENELQRSLMIKKFLSDKVIPHNADPQVARFAIDRWVQEASAKANVRIALAEQGGGPGCGGCGQSANKPCGMQPGAGCAQNGGGPCVMQQGAGGKPSAGAAGAASPGKASEAGLQYWRSKHGQGDVTAQVKDFGCHQQVDIVKGKTIIGSLRYQDGSITEL